MNSDDENESNPNWRMKKLRLKTNILTLIQGSQFDVVERRLKKRKEGSKLERYRSKDIEMLTKPDQYGRLPIHWACLSGRNLKKKALHALLDSYPESAKHLDKEGSTPLHYLLSVGIANNDVLKILLEKFPKAVTVRDRFGRTPMFHLVANNSIEKMSALAILLDTEDCVTSLTMPCGPLESEMSYESPEGSKNLPHNNLAFPELWDQPPSHRTPLYMMWRIALTHSSKNRWSRGNESLPKLDNTKSLIAINFLGCVYLHQVNGLFKFAFKRYRKMRRKMKKAMQSGMGENGGELKSEALIDSDIGNDMSEHALVVGSDSDTDYDMSLRWYSSNPFVTNDEEGLSSRSFDSFGDRAFGARNIMNSDGLGDSDDEFTTPQSKLEIMINSNEKTAISDSKRDSLSDGDAPRSRWQSERKSKINETAAKNKFIRNQDRKQGGTRKNKRNEQQQPPSKSIDSSDDETTLSRRLNRFRPKKIRMLTKRSNRKKKFQRRKRSVKSLESIESNTKNFQTQRSSKSLGAIDDDDDDNMRILTKKPFSKKRFHRKKKLESLESNTKNFQSQRSSKSLGAIDYDDDESMRILAKKPFTKKKFQPQRSFKSLDSIDDEFSQFGLRSKNIFRSKKKIATMTKFRFTHAVCTFHQWLPKETVMIDIAKKYYPKHFEKKEETTGDIPIHLAIRTGASLDLLKQLLDANKNTASIKTSENQLPLHLVLENDGSNFQKIECILDAYPDGVEMIDEKSGLYPFALPEFHKKDMPSSQPPVLRTIRPHAIPESHSFSEHDIAREKLELERMTSTIKLLLKKPSILKDFAM